MFTTDELNLAQDSLTFSFFTAARQLKIDRAKFIPEQVNIKLFHCFMAAKNRYLKKTNQEIHVAWFLKYII